MKGYEFKITLKKAPIWRRFTLPADITFEYLHNTVQIVMGFKNKQLYEFVFKEEKLSITNDEEAFVEYDYAQTAIGKDHLIQLGLPVPTIAVYKSNEIKIDNLIVKSPKFDYTYDFGDCWEHQIEFLDVVESLGYPQVLKYNGDCPPEDSGGTQAFCDEIKLLKNVEDDQYNKVMAWYVQQGFKVYDIEKTNKNLKTLAI